MADFKTPDEAKDFIAHTTKSGDIYKETAEPLKEKHITVFHIETAEDFCKLVSTAPISDKCKKVMLAKMLNPGISNMRIALTFAMNVDDVEKYEQEGIHICKEMLKRCSIEEKKDQFAAEDVIQREVKKIQGKTP